MTCILNRISGSTGAILGDLSYPFSDKDEIAAFTTGLDLNPV